ncbi:MAG: hypothetical protein H0W76_09670 [Pyrinomonadaceae bacterium]|nr:hypothetical protein [Pyrinomonadaceae bacterium]
MKPKDSCSNAAAQVSRRRFAKGIVASAALAAAPLACSVSSNAQTPPAPKQSPAPPNPQPTLNAAAPTPPSPVAGAYTAVARARFGAQVTDEEMSRIERDLEGNVRSTERLRAFKLNNSDEPDFIFGAG